LTSVYLLIAGEEVIVASDHTYTHTCTHAHNRAHTQTRTHASTPWDSSGIGSGPSQRPFADSTQHSQKTEPMAPAGFEPAILASERPQIHTLDSANMVIKNMINRNKYARLEGCGRGM